MWYVHHQGLTSSAPRRDCFAVLLGESNTCGNTGALPESSTMQLAWGFPRNPPGIETLPSNMPESCLGTVISASKDTLIVMFYIVHKDSAKCVAAQLLLAGQAGMEETKICSTSLFVSSFTIPESWRLLSLARMKQEYVLFSSALIIKTLCILSPTLFEQANGHALTANF